MAETPYLYLDTETTGLDPDRHDIIQMAGMVSLGDRVVEEFNWKVRPFCLDMSVIEERALKINGTTPEALAKYPDPREVHGKLVAMLEKHRQGCLKYVPVGYNVGFDVGFLDRFLRKCGDAETVKMISHRTVDPMSVMLFLDFTGALSLPSYSLVKVCEHFGIPLRPHDAIHDIKATRELLFLLRDRYVVKDAPGAEVAQPGRDGR